jgi:hypothetical protein
MRSSTDSRTPLDATLSCRTAVDEYAGTLVGGRRNMSVAEPLP